MISIAMATYNGKAYVKRQIDSILSQTYKDFELIICDDSSNDGTKEILKAYQESDNRIKLFENENNLGFKRNFEKAISLCSGDYVAPCDQDDIWRDNHLEMLLRLINGKSMAAANAEIVDTEGHSQNYLLSDGDAFFFYNEKTIHYRVFLFGNVFQGTSSLLSRELVNKALPIPEFVEYHDAWFAASALCLKGISYSFDVITDYRIHGKNVSGNHKWIFFKQINSKLHCSGYETDRIQFCTELKNRFDISKGFNIDLCEFEKVLYNRVNRRNRFSTALFYWKFYKEIYTTESKKYRIPRILGILLGR